MTRVLVICKRNIFIQAIRPHLADQGIELVFICNNSSDGLRYYQLLRPDVVLIDALWPYPLYAVSGHELMKRLLTFDATARIVVTSMKPDEVLLMQMKAMGIKGYFAKLDNHVLQKAVSCIDRVLNGDVYFCAADF